MKKTTLLIVLLGLSVSVYAFMEPPRDDIRRLFASLDLSQEQKTQLKTIHKESRDERIKLMDKMDELRDKTEERVMAVLTEKQREQLKARRSEMQRKRDDDGCNRDRMSQHKPMFE